MRRGLWPETRAVVLSPDEKRFTCGNAVFETATGTRLWDLKAEDARLVAAAWSPDGKLLAAGGLTFKYGIPQGVVGLFEADSGRLMKSWRTGQAFIKGLAFSPDSALLVTAGAGDILRETERGEVCLWEVPGGRLIKELDGYFASYAVAAWSPDGSQFAVVTWGEDYKFLKAWHRNGEEVPGTLPDWVKDSSIGREANFNAKRPLAQSANGEWVVEFQERILKLRNKAAPAPLAQITLSKAIERIQDVALSRDGQWLLALTYSPANNSNSFRAALSLRGWRLDEKAGTWREVWRIAAHKDFIEDVSAAKHNIAAVSLNQFCALWNVQSGIVRGVPNERHGRTLELSSDGQRLAASHLWDITKPVPQKGRKLVGWNVLRFSRDSRLLLQNGGFFDIRTGKAAEIVEQEPYGADALEYISSGTFSGDGKLLATFEDSSNRLLIWNVRTARITRALRGAFPVEWMSLEFAPQGALLAVVGNQTQTNGRRGNAYLALYEGATGKLIRRFATVDNYQPTALAFSPDGKTLMTSGYTQLVSRGGKISPSATPVSTVRFWDVATGKGKGALPIYSGLPLPFAWLNNETVVTSDGLALHLWNVNEQKLMADLEILAVHRAKDEISLDWLVTTPDGRFDCSPGGEKYLRWWANGEATSTPPSGARRVPGLLVALRF